MKSSILFLMLFVFSGSFLQAQLIYNENYKKQLDQQYASPLFRDHNAYMIVPGEDPSAMSALTVFQYLQGRIAGLTIDNSRIYAPVLRWRMNRPALYLNEMRVDAATLATMNVNDIGLIKIFRPPFVGAIGNGGGGAIVVYTLQGDDEEEELE